MLGTDLARELAGRYEVTGTDVNGGLYRCDITDREKIAGIIEKVMPDIVIHAAAWADVDGCELDKKKAYAVNSAGTGNVAVACKSAGARMIYVSTDFVFDGRKTSPYREADKTGPLCVYADSKLKGEALTREASEKNAVVRTSWLYGKNGKNFVDTIIAKAKADGKLRVVDDQVGSPTYTVDLAGAIRRLIDKPEAIRGIYHVSNSGSVSWYEYAKAILKISGIKAKVDPISSKELARPAIRPAMSAMDISKFEKITGYKMRGWKAALREYLS